VIRIFIDVTGGIVQRVVSDVPGVEVMAVDYDDAIHKPKDDPHCKELVNDCGRKDWASVDRDSADFDPKFVDHYFKQAE